MVEENPPQKNDEQYPLLKVEAGGGEGGCTELPNATPQWDVTCSKRSWFNRWPEFISACWMTGMLLGIFFLILYGLGLGIIQRRTIFMRHYNDSNKPANEVYFHHIVQHENVPFAFYSEYLSNVASLYSSLRFNVIFLIDDSYQNAHHASRHSRFFNQLISYNIKTKSQGKYEETQKDLKDFQQKHTNVKITIMPLCRYMLKTPLRYKWRTVPMSHVIFYVRVYSVWQSGGIGMDLDFFNSQYNHGQLAQPRIRAILNQHNNGINPDEYTKILNKISRDEQNEMFSMFNTVLQQILNVFNIQEAIEKDISLNPPPIRTHRGKRETAEISTFNISNHDSVIKDPKLITNNIDVSVSPLLEIRNASEINNTEISETNYTQKSLDQAELHFDNGTKLNNINSSKAPELILFEMSLQSDNNLGPTYQKSEPMVPLIRPNNLRNPTNSAKPQYLLSINVDGLFVAASSKQHPLLLHIMSTGCQRMPPRYAIQDALMSQCSTIIRNDLYCSNIYLL